MNIIRKAFLYVATLAFAFELMVIVFFGCISLGMRIFDPHPPAFPWWMFGFYSGAAMALAILWGTFAAIFEEKSK